MEDTIESLVAELEQVKQDIVMLTTHLEDKKLTASGLRHKISQLVHEAKVTENNKYGKRWTKEKMVEAVKKFHEDFQRAPERDDFDNIEWLPNPSTVWRHWESFADLREAAGLPPGLRGRGGAGRGGGWTPERQRKPFAVGSRT